MCYVRIPVWHAVGAAILDSWTKLFIVPFLTATKFIYTSYIYLMNSTCLIDQWGCNIWKHGLVEVFSTCKYEWGITLFLRDTKMSKIQQTTDSQASSILIPWSYWLLYILSSFSSGNSAIWHGSTGTWSNWCCCDCLPWWISFALLHLITCASNCPWKHHRYYPKRKVSSQLNGRLPGALRLDSWDFPYNDVKSLIAFVKSICV